MAVTLTTPDGPLEMGTGLAAGTSERRTVHVNGQPAKGAAAMARHLHALFEKAKRVGDIDPPVEFLHEKVTQSLAAVPIPVACGRGCTHCCNGWLSVTAPEILSAAKRIRI